MKGHSESTVVVVEVPVVAIDIELVVRTIDPHPSVSPFTTTITAGSAI